MKINIFDVTHGFCALLTADNNNLMLFDCGYNEKTGFRPSMYLRGSGCSGIEYLIIQNFDQDHINDLPNLRKYFPIELMFRNRSISTSILRTIKEKNGPLTLAMNETLDMHDSYIIPITTEPELPNIEFKTFYNEYPEFTDTNNLSLVSFIHYSGVGIIFPGDLETTGWKELLKNPIFRDHLKRTSIFVASHHGRISGYCEDIFEYCHPDIIIISDKEMVHETQKQTYAKHAKGVIWNGGPNKRYVLTTRSDGMITIDFNLMKGSYYISTS